MEVPVEAGGTGSPGAEVACACDLIALHEDRRQRQDTAWKPKVSWPGYTAVNNKTPVYNRWKVRTDARGCPVSHAQVLVPCMHKVVAKY